MKRIWLYLSLISVCSLPLIVGQQPQQGAMEVNAVPRLVKFSGTVKDRGGNPASGLTSMTFSIYKDEQGGSPLWHEIQNVQLDADANYTVMLGATLPLPAEMFSSNEARWLSVEPAGQPEQPRALLLSVPYALKAVDAETLGGKPASAFLLAPAQSDASTSAASKDALKPADASAKTAEAPLASVSGSGTPTFVPLWTGTTTLGNSVLFQSGSGASAKIGLNTKTPTDTLQVVAPNQLGVLIQGPVSGVGAGLDMETTGTGGKGWELLATGNSSAQGVGKLNIRDLSTAADIFTMAPGGLVGIGTTTPGDPLQVTDKNHPGASAAIAGDCSSGFCAGVFGDALSTTGATAGVSGQTLSSTAGAAGVKGTAVASTGETFGVAGFNFSSSRFAAGVAASNSSGTGQTFGLSASAASLNGTGVFATAARESATASGIVGCCPVGVWGDSASNAGGAAGLVGTADDGRGLLAQNNSPSGVPAAFAFNTQTGNANLPVFVSAGNVGGVFRACVMDTNGNLGCAGTKSAVVPVDNGQRQVALYAVEAPQNWFEDFGSGHLATGAATIKLDPTFGETVNTAVDYHVFLTPEGDCRGLYVVNKTATAFEVHELGGGQSNVAFSYRIIALRRGYEAERLDDMTERINRIKAQQITPRPGPKVTLPAPRVRSANGEEAVKVASNGSSGAQ